MAKVGISPRDRRRLQGLRDRFLEHRRTGVYCAIALAPTDGKSAAPLEDFGKIFRDGVIPLISGSSVFTIPGKTDPPATERLHIAASAEWNEMLYVDGVYSTLTAFSELGDDAWSLLPRDFRKRRAVLLPDCRLSPIRRRYVLWSQIVFNILSNCADAIEFSQARTADGIPRAAWLTENAFLASADAIALILEDGRRPHLICADTKNDARKKLKKAYRRPMNVAAADCIRIFRKAKKGDCTVKMQGIVEEYVDKHGGSVAGILRRLNDNSELWNG